MEEKIILDEASALATFDPKKVADENGTEYDLTTLDVEDENWNKIFKFYRSGDAYRTSTNTQYWVVKTSDLVSKSAGDLGAGYIKFGGVTNVETGERNVISKILFAPIRWVAGSGVGRYTKDTLNSGDVTVVTNKADASMFTDEDADAVIKAIKNNKDLKTVGVRFSKESVDRNDANKAKGDFPREIFRAYFKRLCKDDANGLTYIASGESALFQICSPLAHPLVGNNFLRIFSEAFNGGHVEEGWVTGKSVYVINNLVVKREFSSADLMKPISFKSSLVFNRSLYNYSENDIFQILNLYDEALGTFAYSRKITNAALKTITKNAQRIIAKNLVLKYDDTDVFKQIVDGTSTDVSAIHQYGKDLEEDPAILTSEVRNPELIESMFIKCGGERKEASEDEEDYDDYELVIINKFTTTANPGKVNILTDEDDGFIEFESVKTYNFAKDSTIKLVYKIKAAPIKPTNYDSWENEITDLTTPIPDTQFDPEKGDGSADGNTAKLRFKKDKSGVKLHGVYEKTSSRKIKLISLDLR